MGGLGDCTTNTLKRTRESRFGFKCSNCKDLIISNVIVFSVPAACAKFCFHVLHNPGNQTTHPPHSILKDQRLT